jgi:hypothetical protein
MQVETLAEKLLFTTLRVETASAKGHGGTGTGFFYQYTDAGQIYPFIVTNKHVVRGADKGWITFHKSSNGQPVLGTAHRFEITDFEKAWHGHSDAEIDVAVMPCAALLEQMQQQGMPPYCQWIDRGITAGIDLHKQLDALEEVVFIGYPNGIWDSRNFLPIIRRGTTATPIVVDFQGKKQFLIDASVFPGSSGSPVFLFNQGIFADRQGNSTIGTRLAFLGVVASVFFRQDVNEIQLIPQNTANMPVAIAKEMIDLGIVFKAHTVIETIEDLLRTRGVQPSRA